MPRFSIHLGVLLAASMVRIACPAAVAAEEWSAYRIVPASAAEFVLEVTGESRPGDVVSIGRPESGDRPASAHQRWRIEPVAGNWCRLRPASAPTLSLAVAKGATGNGAGIVVEPDADSPAQLWMLTKQDDGGYTILPKHAAGMGLDQFGGKREAGARVDLWTNAPGDRHLR